jgi:nicotinate-nucleotide adenylyltransferase
MPASAAPHKPAVEDPGPEHRLAMCRLAVKGMADVTVCDLEIQRGGTSYTVDTLRAIHADRSDLELTLIVGADTACTLPSWREPVALLELTQLAVADRQGEGRVEVLEVLCTLRPEPRVDFLDMPAIDISSSAVRTRVAQGGSIDGLLDPTVASYINEHRLYGLATAQ